MAYIPPNKVGQTHDKISDAKAYLEPRFTHAKIIGTDRSDVITAEYLEAQQIFNARVHADFLKGRRPAGYPDLNPGDTSFDWATQKNMGLLATTAPPPSRQPLGFYSFTGTWGAWNNGFGSDVGVRVDQRKFQHQGLGFDTNAFLIGNDPGHSYIDMLNDGENEYWKFGRYDRRRKVLSGYSGGANCVAQVLNHWAADRRNEIAAVLQFGDPSRPPGKTLLGNDPGGHGISEDFPPDWVLNRYYSFTIDGDMNPNAVGLLPVFYDILSRLEATPEFAMYFFQLLVGQLGGLTTIGSQMLGVGGNPAIAGFGQLAGLLPLITGGGAEPVPNLGALLAYLHLVFINRRPPHA